MAKCLPDPSAHPYREALVSRKLYLIGSVTLLTLTDANASPVNLIKVQRHLATFRTSIFRRRRLGHFDLHRRVAFLSRDADVLRRAAREINMLAAHVAASIGNPHIDALAGFLVGYLGGRAKRNLLGSRGGPIAMMEGLAIGGLVPLQALAAVV